MKEKIKFKKKWILIPAIIFIVIVVIGVVIGPFKSSKAIGTPVSASTAETMTLEQAVSIKGTVEGTEKAQIQSTLSSEVKAVYVKEGDIVSKGQQLALLDDGSTQEQYNKAKIDLSELKRQYDLAKSLYEQGAKPQEEYLKAKADYESASAMMSSYDLTKKNITSPINGTVTRVNVTVGSNANDTENNEPMFIIEDLKNLQLKVNISEYDISKIKVGQEVGITAEMLGDQSVKGVVSRIAPSGEQKKDGTEMVIPVVIAIEKGDSNLIAGVTAKANILIQKKENALSVPIDAVLEDVSAGKTYVFVIKKNVLHKVEVKTGLEGDFNIEIISDKVKPGDQVVLAPTYSLTDGMPVTVSGNDAVQ
ncbi:efflux RND transporter periplasmic adaptor subunit [Clostridium aminobutyricum]|uniref:Efflux RND transporter periplasmic adaptor subunit n=1 Tax=Clostridium aminobutyricum TaxID=33953 RepID=A0A939IIQ6_CLOAM|nr:efflux RND transporter periplasmic adaptor subunit [Clostridium aminobutyricum]MBN7773321.1 efflux RND transporter periplasmic adaptor subunit [Clostridium aminobutyricum]